MHYIYIYFYIYYSTYLLIYFHLIYNYSCFFFFAQKILEAIREAYYGTTVLLRKVKSSSERRSNLSPSARRERTSNYMLVCKRGRESRAGIRQVYISGAYCLSHPHRIVPSK